MTAAVGTGFFPGKGTGSISPADVERAVAQGLNTSTGSGPGISANFEFTRFYRLMAESLEGENPEQSGNPKEVGLPWMSNKGYMELVAPELWGLVSASDFRELVFKITGHKDPYLISPGDKMKILRENNATLLEQLEPLLEFRPDISLQQAYHLFEHLPSMFFSLYVNVLKSRPDINVSDIDQMCHMLASALHSSGIDDPGAFLSALGSASEILINRADITPQSLGQMLMAVCSNSTNSKEAMSIFQQICGLLLRRPDIKPEQAVQMFSSLTKKTPGTTHADQAFSDAVSLLEQRSDLSPSDVENPAFSAHALATSSFAGGAQGSFSNSISSSSPNTK